MNVHYHACPGEYLNARLFQAEGNQGLLDFRVSIMLQEGCLRVLMQEMPDLGHAVEVATYFRHVLLML